MFDTNKSRRLMDIMFEEDKARKEKGQPLIYHTEEDFKEEEKEREKNLR